jgi:DNA-binding SARP family transcriptional activator
VNLALAEPEIRRTFVLDWPSYPQCRNAPLARIAVRLFGSASVRLPEGSPQRPPLGGKAIALLAYLLLEPGAHSREQLAALLWGDFPEAQARASLRQALKSLREHLGPALRVSRTDAAIADGIDCDAVAFQEAIRTDPAAATRYDVPHFCAGLSLRHAPQFDEWLSATRAAFLRRYHDALGLAAREMMRRWQWREAVELAERWQAADPLSDEAARLIVEAEFLSGNRVAALARYREFHDRLAAESGAEPAKAMQQLVRRIEAEAAPAGARPITADWQSRLPSLESSLVGREQEMESLMRGWRALPRGTGRIVLLEGEAGVGKTRLATEFLRRAVADGGTVLRGPGYDARSGVPFAPVVEALRTGLQAPGLAATDPEWLAESARLLPELRQRFPGLPEPTPPPAPAEGWRLFEAVAQVLLALAAERPVVVFLDDLQWCDADSCNLLHFLIRRVEAAPILWCLTLTLGELQRDAPAARLWRVLRAKPHAAMIAVSPLDEESLWRLLRELGHLSSPTGGRRLAGRLHQATAGNPFYVVELLKTLFAQGWIFADPVSGEWHAAAAAEAAADPLSMAPTVHDAIAERIESLPPELYDVLITIALTGACHTHVLSHVHGISRLRAATLADELVERRLVAEDQEAYRCAHPVIARVVRDGLTGSRRRELHRMIALALELVALADGIPTPSGEIARHAELGGERLLAYRCALSAGRAAMQRYAYEEALTWLDLAAAMATSAEESDTASRLTEQVVSVAGWREVPSPVRRHDLGPRELEPQDLDLPAHS